VEPANVVSVGVLEKEPPIFIEPEPVNVNWHPVVPVVIAPEILTIPVEIVIMSLGPIVVALMVSEPEVSDPAFTAMVQVCPAFGNGMLISPVTVREFAPEIVTELEVTTAAKVSVLQAATTSTVTVIPLLIVTASAAVGTAAPPHVAVLLQFPETDAVLGAA